MASRGSERKGESGNLPGPGQMCTSVVPKQEMEPERPSTGVAAVSNTPTVIRPASASSTSYLKQRDAPMDGARGANQTPDIGESKAGRGASAPPGAPGKGPRQQQPPGFNRRERRVTRVARRTAAVNQSVNVGYGNVVALEDASHQKAMEIIEDGARMQAPS